jgi:hypothetical protein
MAKAACSNRPGGLIGWPQTATTQLNRKLSAGRRVALGRGRFCDYSFAPVARNRAEFES